MSGSQVGITIDRSRCALCGEPNECALAQDGVESDKPCWCVGESFSASLRARATDEDGGGSCICRDCLAKDRQAPDFD